MYLIIDPKITDRDAYVATVQKWQPAAHTADHHGGRVLVCGDQVTVIEGDWKPTNLLIVEFPDADAMNNWMQSADYADMMAVVGQSADVSTVTVVPH